MQHPHDVLNHYSYLAGLAGNTYSSSQSVTTQAYITQLPDDDDESVDENIVNITAEPSLDFTRKTWWDSLLALYSSPNTFHLPTLNQSERNDAMNLVTNDIRFLFRSTNYWFSFFHVPHFLSSYFDPEKRERMQPALLPAMLMMATFLQSSEAGLGKIGRAKAFRLRDIAQGALEASFNARWIDETLAQAAWLLAMFEVCADPFDAKTRSASGVMMLDTIMRALSLTFLDVDDPKTSKFAPRSVPSVPSTHDALMGMHSMEGLQSMSVYPVVGATQMYHSMGCSCASMSLGERWPGSHEYAPLWVSAPAWDDTSTEIELRKEVCRRVCWSSLMLAAGLTSYIASSNGVPPDLYLSEPSNFALLFPGETPSNSSSLSMALTSTTSAKDSIWALIYRAMLLWHSCLRVRHNPNVSDKEAAQFGVNAWLEADAIERALDAHTCGMERTFLFQGHEYLFNVRTCISQEFHKFIPPNAIGLIGLSDSLSTGLFHRKKAEEWLSHQANLARRVVDSMHTLTGQATSNLHLRPFFIFWFMSQIGRSLNVWYRDQSLTLALDVAIAFLQPIDYLNALWPHEEQRRKCEKLRNELAQCCAIAGRPPPQQSPFDATTMRPSTSTL